MVVSRVVGERAEERTQRRTTVIDQHAVRGETSSYK